ncbi:hypothetical protein FF38_08181 [Lucilia cuprina]|uniref:Secreted protein n=1 Tax=Lucilia cuprina TaxID=7375 RepID=A0A0L0C368_LUCCU|nr:hypothetical protein FF38_08181 [Lucilia cuprina]
MKYISKLLLWISIFAAVTYIYADRVDGPKANANSFGKEVAEKAVHIIKDKIDDLKLSLSGHKEIHPILKKVAKYLKPHISIDEDLDVSCISGFNDKLAVFVYKMEHNDVLDYCQTAEGKANKFCTILPEPMSDVYAEIIEMVKLTMEYCKNNPA